MTKKFLTIGLDSELVELIQKLKMIIREALWAMAEKILPENVHTCNK